MGGFHLACAGNHNAVEDDVSIWSWFKERRTVPAFAGHLDPPVYVRADPAATEQDEWAKISYGNKRRIVACFGRARRAGVIVSNRRYYTSEVPGSTWLDTCHNECLVRFPNGEERTIDSWTGEVGDYWYMDSVKEGPQGKQNFEAMFHNDFTVKNADEHWNEECLVVNQPRARLASQEVRRLGMLYDHGKPNNFSAIEGPSKRGEHIPSIGSVTIVGIPQNRLDDA